MTEGKTEGKSPRRATRRKKEEAAPAAGAEISAATAGETHGEPGEAPRKRTRRTTKKAAADAQPAAPPASAGEEGTGAGGADAAPAAKAPRTRRRKEKSGEAAAPEAAPTATPAQVVRAEEEAGAKKEGTELPAPERAGEEAGAPRSRRRRSRRGGKGHAAEGEAGHAPVPEARGAREEAPPGDEGEAQEAGAPPGEAGAPDEAGEGGGKRRRRRRRRRGRKGKGAEGISPQAGAAPADDVAGDAEFDEDEEAASAPAGSGEPDEADAGAPGAPGEAGEGSGRRRRRRRRGKGGARPEVVEAGRTEAPAVQEAGIAAEAEGTDDEDLEGEAEYSDTSAGSESRRVMMIDGVHPEEIRVAIVNETVLDYFEFENQRRKQFKGNIYKGKVINIAPAIEAAFVEFGGGRHGFLPLNEYCGGALAENLDSWDEGERRPTLRSGMEILVQVTKEESSVKGAALTSYISIAGRYLVMMLGMKRFGISKKITGEKERERLRKIMEKLEYPEHLGFIVRTEGEGRNLKDLKADLQNLIRLWHRVLDGGKTLKAPALLYEEQDIVIRTLRDSYSSDISEVLMNTEDAHRKAIEFFDIYYPKQKNKLKLYRQKRPLFSKFNLDEQLEKATSRRVGLPSGGHIVIDRTEALWSIDVNSGRSSKDRDIEDTAYRTNREAAVEVTRQLRIRDMGGLIVVDFIDMENKNHIKEVERTIKEGLKKDKAKNDVSSMGKFGLVAISRQRMGISFFDVMLKDCDLCAGTGFVPTGDAQAVRMLRKLHDEMSREGAKELLARVHPALLETLLNQKREEISRLERLCNTRVAFAADPSLPPGGFHIGAAPVAAGV